MNIKKYKHSQLKYIYTALYFKHLDNPPLCL